VIHSGVKSNVDWDTTAVKHVWYKALNTSWLSSAWAYNGVDMQHNIM